MPIITPSYLAGLGGAELVPALRWVSIDRVRKPWAIVVPNGVAFARSGSTWMNWWSWVMSANWSIWLWVTSNHSPVPSSLPTSALKCSNAFAAASLMGIDPRASDRPQPRVELVVDELAGLPATEPHLAVEALGLAAVG